MNLRDAGRALKSFIVEAPSELEGVKGAIYGNDAVIAMRCAFCKKPVAVCGRGVYYVGDFAQGRPRRVGVITINRVLALMDFAFAYRHSGGCISGGAAAQRAGTNSQLNYTQQQGLWLS